MPTSFLTTKISIYGLSKSKLRGIIVDCSVIDSFSVPSVSAVPERDTFMITVYKTELSLSLLLEKLGVEDRFYRYSFYGNDTISVTRELYDLLSDKVPYMISMISSDFAQIKLDEIEHAPDKETIDIPDPTNEPVIGVIDTFFDESVYEIEQSESTLTIPESLSRSKVFLRYDPLEQYYVQTVFPSYFSYGYFETRSNGITLSLGNTKSYWSSEDKAEGWTATYMKFRNNSNWNNTNIMKEQFYCHARLGYVFIEQEWNLEPWRTSMNPITCN